MSNALEPVILSEVLNLKKSEGGTSYPAIGDIAYLPLDKETVTHQGATFLRSGVLADSADYQDIPDYVEKSSDVDQWVSVSDLSSSPYSIAVHAETDTIFIGRVRGVDYSTDGGKTFTTCNITWPDESSVVYVQYVNGFVYAMMPKFAMYRTSDGVNWEQVTISLDVSIDSIRYGFRFIAFNGSVYVVVSNSFINNIWYSTDGLVFTTAKLSVGYLSSITSSYDGYFWATNSYNPGYSLHKLVWNPATLTFSVADWNPGGGSYPSSSGIVSIGTTWVAYHNYSQTKCFLFNTRTTANTYGTVVNNNTGSPIASSPHGEYLISSKNSLYKGTYTLDGSSVTPVVNFAPSTTISGNVRDMAYGSGAYWLITESNKLYRTATTVGIPTYEKYKYLRVK